jgi:hypothetical protein
MNGDKNCCLRYIVMIDCAPFTQGQTSILAPRFILAFKMPVKSVSARSRADQRERQRPRVIQVHLFAVRQGPDALARRVRPY